MQKLAIIADDFTGAGDSSIHFCHAGYSVFLPVSLTEDSIPDGVEILAVNSESRLINSDDSYNKIIEIIGKCRTWGAQSFYKKIDSTKLKRNCCESFILTPDSHEDMDSTIDQHDSSEKIAEFLAKVTAFLCRELDISVLITIGGHTTFNIVKSLDATGVLYQGEIIPGTPLGHLEFASHARHLTLITKSGSFGDANALLQIHNFVKKHKTVNTSSNNLATHGDDASEMEKEARTAYCTRQSAS